MYHWEKIYQDLNGLPIRKLKTISSWYFEIWKDFWHFFTLFLLHKNVGDFKSEIEEQKKVHLCVDMTNISPPSEKNVPLLPLTENCIISCSIKSGPGARRVVFLTPRWQLRRNQFWDDDILSLWFPLNHQPGVASLVNLSFNVTYLLTLLVEWVEIHLEEAISNYDFSWLFQ